MYACHELIDLVSSIHVVTWPSFLFMYILHQLFLVSPIVKNIGYFKTRRLYALPDRMELELGALMYHDALY